MARTQETIFNLTVTAYVAAAVAVGITTINPAAWSDFNLQQLILFDISGAIALFEQIFDNYVAQVEAVAAIAAPQTNLWMQNFCLNIFQYNVTVPQILQLDETGGTFAPLYPTVNNTFKIVTQCAVVPGIFGTTTVKVAKAGPVALAAGELSALQSALDLISVPGITINAFSGNADKLFVGGTVTYTGGYSAVIQSTVVAAILSYLAAIPVSGIVGINSPVGVMKLTDLIAAVRAVPGVIDFELNNVNARPDTTGFVPGVNNLVSANTWLTTEWNSGLSGSGYIIGENTSGYTLNDSITYVPQ